MAAMLLLLALSNNSYAQCLTGGSITPATLNAFSTTAEGYAGNFGWTSGGSGQLESTPVSDGAKKVLTTSTFHLPANATTIGWSFNLGGTANVTSYTVDANYWDGVIKTVPVCPGGALTTNGGNLVFATEAPTELIGRDFQLVITFTSSSTGSKVLTVDNFRTDATNAAIVLPVTISYFSAAAGSGGIQLTWMVGTESNVNRYEVERSSNGKTFTKIGSVLAANLVTYKYLDKVYSTGSNYYRLKTVDNDGTFKYSKTVLYKVGKNGIALRAYPVPAENETVLQHDASKGKDLIRLLSADGQVVRVIKPQAGSVETPVNLSAVRPGLYIVQYISEDGETETTRLVKQ